MSRPKAKRVIPRLTLTRAEGAESLGVSLDFFDAQLAPDLRINRRGRLKLVPPAEFERWIDHHADRASAAA